MIEIGKKDAAAVVGLGERNSFIRFNEWYSSKSLRKKYAFVEDYIHSAY